MRDGALRDRARQFVQVRQSDRSLYSVWLDLSALAPPDREDGGPRTNNLFIRDIYDQRSAEALGEHVVNVVTALLEEGQRLAREEDTR